jgi:hypothetical protein
MQHAYLPVFPLLSLCKPGTEVTIKHLLKVMDAQQITQCRETKVPIVNSEAKEEAFLHFLYKFSPTQELMNWMDGAISSPNLNTTYMDPTKTIGERSLQQGIPMTIAILRQASQKLPQTHLCRR